MDAELERIADLVRTCGQLVKSADRSRLRVDAKGGHANFVTDCDTRVQARLREGLAALAPGAAFIGEEGAARRFSPRGAFFIVDPIDGTTNFIKDYKASCVSVALVVDGAAELAAVYNPYLDEMFTARRGGGAFCNGARLSVSAAPLSRGLVLFGTSPYDEALSERTFRLAYALFRRALDVRRSGSAALDLCAVAAGRAELFFELSLSPWDHAAGGLLVREAGGGMSDVEGGAVVYDRPCSVLARGAGVPAGIVRDFRDI